MSTSDCTTKICIDCHEEKPIAEFHRNSRMADGRLRTCRNCTLIRRGTTLKNCRKVTIDGKRQCTKCNEWFPLTFEFWYHHAGMSTGFNPRCRKCIDEAVKRWNDDNSEHMREYRAEWEKQNPDKRFATVQRYYQRHPGRIKEPQRIYIQTPEGKMTAKVKNSKRRARFKSADGHFTGKDVKKQYEYQNGKCYWCGKKLKDKYHIDHVIPLSRGGSNWPENIVCACHSCNESKGAKLPQEWGFLF